MTPSTKKRIDSIPPDVWYKRDTGDAFCSAADKMLDHGIKEDEVVSMLESLFYAVANEYGG